VITPCRERGAIDRDGTGRVSGGVVFGEGSVTGIEYLDRAEIGDRVVMLRR
jgi:hypothetical protein